MGRSGKLSFKELVKNALSKRPTKNGGRRSTILIDQAVPFKSQYLAGFKQKNAILNMKQSKTRPTKLQDYSESLLRDSASGYTTLTNVRTDISKSRK